MKRTLTLLMAACALALAPVQLFAADGGTLAARIRHEFPLADRAIGLNSLTSEKTARAVSRQTAGGAFVAGRFSDPFTLQHGTQRVTLRAQEAGQSRATRRGPSAEFAGAFRGVDALRTVTANGTSEALLIRDASAARRISYEVVDTFATAEVAPAGRGVRFIGRSPGSDVVLAAPIVIDATGRPSNKVRWVVDRHSGDRTVLRLEVTDRSLRYPVVAARTDGGSSRPALRVVTNGTGALAGSVTASGTNAALSDALVIAYDRGGEFAGYAVTAEDGTYFISDLDTGIYYVLAIGNGVDSELYNNIPCPNGDCDPTSGTPISVTDGVTTSSINFVLTSQGARISGIVTDENATPLLETVVVLYDTAGEAITSGITDEAGAYSITTEAGGTFYARTFNNTSPGLLDQLFDGIDCTTCDVTSGDAITVAGGAVRSDIDFALREGGRIVGHVLGVDRPNGIESARVVIYGADGELVSFAETGADGSFTSFHGLEAGNYYVTATAGGYVTQLYDHVACTNCNPTTGTAVHVTVGHNSSDVDFELDSQVATVSGTVTDASTSGPLEGVDVSFYDVTGVQVGSTTTGPDGSYTLNLGSGGTFYARTFVNNYPGYLDQLYNGIDCSGCDVTTGDEIDLTPGEPVTGIDFALNNDGGSIAGRITDEATTGGLSNGFVIVYSESGEVATYGTTDGTGLYSLFHGLTTGNYFVAAYASGHASEIYDNQPCGQGCDPTAGTAVAVTRGATTVNIDFALRSQTCVITVEPESVPNGAVGTPYPATQITSPDGVAPVTFVQSGGELPPGLSIDGNGLITGTPTDPGSFTFSVGAEDVNGCTGDHTYTIVISGDASSTTLTTSATAAAYGTSITFTASVTPSTRRAPSRSTTASCSSAAAR